MKVAIYGKKINKQNAPYFVHFLSILKNYGWDAVLEKELKEQLVKKVGISDHYEVFSTRADLKTGIDLAFSIGGDGTFIKTVSYIRDSGVPILGINTGRLGFLAGVTVAEAVAHAIENLKDRKFSIEKRSLLKLETKNNLFGEINFALNEFTVQRKETSAMMTIHTSINGEFLNSYWADGLIISTPTGSTAYSLSCGGPLMVPDSKSFVITPLSPHNLNVRPLIVPEDSIISLRVEGRSIQHLATLDARSAIFTQDVELTIRKEDFKISLIRFNDHHFFNTIREKLIWGHDARN